MAYIGTKPTIGNFQICDAISVVNGQAAYTMQVGGVNVSPQSSNHMIVSLNGTIQKPGGANPSFTVSGSTITFASNLATGDVIDFIQILGDVLDLGVPSDATVTTAKLASDSVTSAKVADGVLQPPHRNIIINGDMSIAQRATSATALAHQSYGTVDRISQNLTADSFVCTGEQSTDSPEGFDYSFKVACTTADTSLAAGDRLFLYQRVEDRNLGYLKFGTSNAVSLTLSFHVKSNKTGTYQVNLWHNNASKFVSATYTISSADTWEKKTLTFIGDTSTSMANDSASALQVEMVLLGGTTYTSGSVSSTYTNTAANRAAGQTVNIADSTSNTWQITGMQLEVGTSASDFEFLPVDVNLRRCQRYFQMYVEGGNTSSKIPIALTAYGSNNATGGVPYYAEMRSSPSASHSNLTCNYGGGTTSITGISYYATAYASGMDITVSGQSWSTGRCVTIQYSATGAYMRFDAEL
jgi:hypothetical protein